jgi:hypothetical protein
MTGTLDRRATSGSGDNGGGPRGAVVAEELRRARDLEGKSAVVLCAAYKENGGAQKYCKCRSWVQCTNMQQI